MAGPIKQATFHQLRPVKTSPLGDTTKINLVGLLPPFQLVKNS
jgi:hypothetical protein